MQNIFFKRRITEATEAYRPIGFVRRMLCIIFLILAAFESDVFGAELVAVRGTTTITGYGKTVCSSEMFTATGASAMLGAVKTPVKRTGLEGVGKNSKVSISLAYVRLSIAVLFAVIILAARHAVFKKKGRGRLRVVIEDSETVTDYRETELHDMPRSFAIGSFIACADLENEDVAFTVPLIGERLYVENYSELAFFKNGEKMLRHFSIIYGDSITFRFQRFDVTIVYLNE